MKKVFECIRCGKCCEGEGGIYLAEGEAGLIADYLGLNRMRFVRESCMEKGGRLYIRTSESGACLFYDPQESCRIHSVKPARCRLWPFFEANLKDPQALEEAKDACPGIRPDCSHEEFVKEWERLVRKGRGF